MSHEADAEEVAPLADLAVLDALLPEAAAEIERTPDAEGDAEAVSVDDVLQQFDTATVLPDDDLPSSDVAAADSLQLLETIPTNSNEDIAVAQAQDATAVDAIDESSVHLSDAAEPQGVEDATPLVAVAPLSPPPTEETSADSEAITELPCESSVDSEDRATEEESPDSPTSVIEDPTPTSLEPPPTPVETQEPMPPPAPTAPVFIGSLVTEKDAAGDDDSDSDDDAADGAAALPPPLNLPVVQDDDEEELEVDPEVSKEILSAVRRETTTTVRPPEQQENALLAALGSSAPVNEFSSLEDVPANERFEDNEDNEIKLSVVTEDIEDDDARERRAPHPESSEGVFGIAYKSLKKAPRRDTGVVKDSYSVGAGFAELESELTLSSDASLGGRSAATTSSTQLLDEREDEEDDDEFASSAVAASPSRVNAFLEQLPTRRQHAEEDAERDLVVEMKRATEAEKSQLTESDAAKAARETDAENAITLKELHSIYKRGLGDQEVRLMDDAQEHEAIKTVAEATPAMSVMGRLLNGATGVRSTPIVEEDEDEDENEEERASLSAAQDDERLQLVDDRGNGDDDDDGRSTETPTANEWLEIQLLRKASMSPPKAEFEADGDSSDAVRPPSPLPSPSRAPSVAVTRITYAAALHFVLEDESLLDARDRIVVEELSAPSSCFTCFSRPRLAFPDAEHERERLFCAAATAFDARNTTFVAMLQTVFRQLTRAPRDVPLSGSHWEQIGFQGNDPATDLRGCGVLSLLQMLFLVERHEPLAQRCLRASHHATRHFPLACALINVTLQCLLALRSGALFKECNAQRSVFQGVNALFVAITTQLVEALETSTEQIPFVMKRVLDHGRLHPDKVIDAVLGPQHSVDGELSKAGAAAGASASASATASARRKSSAAHASSHAEFSEIALHSVDE